MPTNVWPQKDLPQTHFAWSSGDGIVEIPIDPVKMTFPARVTQDEGTPSHALTPHPPRKLSQ